MQLHRLVQAILLSRQAVGTARDGTASVALRLLRETVPTDPWSNPATWPTWRQLLPHVLTVTDWGSESANEDIVWLLDCAATYLHAMGSPKLARPLSERAFELYQRLRDEDHLASVVLAGNLAFSLQELGEHQQARELHEDTLTRRRRILGKDHLHTLYSANNLALFLHELGEHQQARELHEDTLTRYRQVLGKDHSHTLDSANNLATVLRALGEHQQARQLEEYVRAHRKG